MTDALIPSAACEGNPRQVATSRDTGADSGREAGSERAGAAPARPRLRVIGSSSVAKRPVVRRESVATLRVVEDVAGAPPLIWTVVER